MKAVSKIVLLSAFKEANGFSSDLGSGKKIAPQSMPLENGKGPENKGLQALPGTPPHSSSGEKGDAACLKKMKAGTSHGPNPSKGMASLGSKLAKALKAQSPKPPTVTPSPGEDGYLHDCVVMSATNLRLAYPGEYNSWRNRKSHCKKNNGWVWDPAWNDFRDFLRDMKPKSSPDATLDRIDNDLKAYGPGFCRWADKVVQNNNKGNNVKLIVPVTGEILTVAKLAKLHSVQNKTIYKWIDKDYTPLELLAGKKSKLLWALHVALQELPLIEQPGKAKRRKFRLTPPDWSNREWDPTPDELDHYYQTGEMRDSRAFEKQAEYEVLSAWIERWNAGLPVSPGEPPKGKFYNKNGPPCPLFEPAPAKPGQYAKPSKHVYADEEIEPSQPGKQVHDEDDFDPTDCVDPADDGDFDDCDPGDNEHFGDDDA